MSSPTPTRFNAGGNSLDRDLVRFPIAVETVEFVAPRWTFETDGDTEGWHGTNQLDPFEVVGGVLATVSTGDDPYMESSAVRFPGPPNPTLTVRMSIDAEPNRTSGQIFFVTQDDPDWDEAKSRTFRITTDGEMHDYEVDLSTAMGWDATITGLRLDPGALPGAAIQVNAIEFR